RLATATTASSAVSAAPLSASLAFLLIFGTLDEHPHSASLRLEKRFRHVAEIFAVGLERKRAVARDLDPVEIVAGEQVANLSTAAQDVAHETRQRPRRDPRRRDDVEAELEPRLRGDVDRPRPRVGVGVSVRDQRERGPAQALDLQSRLEPAEPSAEEGRSLNDEREIAGTAAVVAAAQAVDAPDQLRVEADPGGEREPPSVDTPERDRARTPLPERVGDPARRLDRPP